MRVHAMRCAIHRRHMLIGVLLALACWEASPLVVAWMSPVIVGLVLAAPLTLVDVARRRLGRCARCCRRATGAARRRSSRARAAPPASGPITSRCASPRRRPMVEMRAARRLAAASSPARRAGVAAEGFRQHVARADRRGGDERQRPAHLDGRRADAGGERAVEGAFAEPPRQPAQQILPEELTQAGRRSRRRRRSR